MGNSNSTTNSTVNNMTNQTYVTENDFKQLYSNTSEAVANAMVTNGNTCSTSNTIDQTINFNGNTIRGGLNLSGITQSAKIKVDFSCINVAKAEQEMAQAVLSELMNKINNSTNQAALNAMSTKADASAAAASSGIGFLSGNASSSTNNTTNNTFNLKNVTTNRQNIQTVLKNSINTNFKTENINKCISEMASRQSIVVTNSDITGGVDASGITQEAGITGAVNCVNQAGTIQAIVQKAAAQLGVVVENTTEAKTSSKMETEQKSSSSSETIGPTIPDSCASLMLFSPITSSIVGGILCLLCICLCFILCMFSCMPKSGSS
jgi:hypothetical protein